MGASLKGWVPGRGLYVRGSVPAKSFPSQNEAGEVFSAFDKGGGGTRAELGGLVLGQHSQGANPL